MARISVLMGIYNCADTLAEALDSLYAQTYTDFKIILCDDGSSDDTYRVALEYKMSHDNIILLKNEENKGLNYTLNRCLEYVDTEYCARMDGDDISLPTRFEVEINVLDSHPEYAIVSCPMIYFDEEGERRIGQAKERPMKMDFINGTPFCHAPSMFRTDIIKQVDGYTEDKRLLRVEDYHLWGKVYSNGYIGYNVQIPLYKMRDDVNAYKRRTWSNRRNEIYVRLKIYKMLNIPCKYYIYAFRPLLAYVAPAWLYKIYHVRN